MNKFSTAIVLYAASANAVSLQAMGPLAEKIELINDVATEITAQVDRVGVMFGIEEEKKIEEASTLPEVIVNTAGDAMYMLTYATLVPFYMFDGALQLFAPKVDSWIDCTLLGNCDDLKLEGEQIVYTPPPEPESEDEEDEDEDADEDDEAEDADDEEEE